LTVGVAADDNMAFPNRRELLSQRISARIFSMSDYLFGIRISR